MFESGEGVNTHRYGLLVDPGDGVDLDAALGEDEFLLATVVTHAHLDHIGNLGEASRDGAPMFMSQTTAEIIEHVLRFDPSQYGVTDPSEVLDSIRIVGEEWESVGQGVELRAVPVGHAPGAVGFLVRVAETYHIFITGDFTAETVCGNPGFDPQFGGALTPLRPRTGFLLDETDGEVSGDEGGFGIDILHMNVQSREGWVTEFADGVKAIRENVRNGRKVVVGADSITASHIVETVASWGESVGQSVEIAVVGKAGAVCDAVVTTDERVKTVWRSQKQGTEAVTQADVVVGAPGSFRSGAVRDAWRTVRAGTGVDERAVVQFRTEGRPIEAEDWEAAEVVSVAYMPHPSEDQLATVRREIGAPYLIVNHVRNRGRLKQWRESAPEYNQLVLAAYGEERQPILDDDGVVVPNWVTAQWPARLLEKAQSRRPRAGETDLAEMIPAPTGPTAVGIETDTVAPSSVLETTLSQDGDSLVEALHTQAKSPHSDGVDTGETVTANTSTAQSALPSAPSEASEFGSGRDTQTDSHQNVDAGSQTSDNGGDEQRVAVAGVAQAETRDGESSHGQGRGDEGTERQAEEDNKKGKDESLRGDVVVRRSWEAGGDPIPTDHREAIRDACGVADSEWLVFDSGVLALAQELEETPPEQLVTALRAQHSAESDPVHAVVEALTDQEKAMDTGPGSPALLAGIDDGLTGLLGAVGLWAVHTVLREQSSPPKLPGTGLVRTAVDGSELERLRRTDEAGQRNTGLPQAVAEMSPVELITEYVGLPGDVVLVPRDGFAQYVSPVLVEEITRVDGSELACIEDVVEAGLGQLVVSVE